MKAQEGKERLIQKIQRCLALGESSNENEANDAIRLAQKLMAQYHIDMKDISGQEAGQVIRQSTGYKAMAQWSMALLQIIAENFRCKGYLHNSEAAFIGEEEDTAVAIELFLWCFDIADKGCRKIRRQYRKEGRPTDGIADTYLQGFLTGLTKALEEQKAAENESFALALVTPTAVVEEFQRMLDGPNTKSVKGRKMNASGDSRAYHNGYSDGQSALRKQIEE